MSEDQEVNPAGEEVLAQMKRDIPTRSGLELDEAPESIYKVLGASIGVGNKDFIPSKAGPGDIYSILERTELEPEEMSLFGRLIMRAEHGLGGAMDRPHAKIAERIVNELRARRSKFRGSLQEFENIMTNWIQRLKAQEDEKLKEQSKRMVGS